MLDDWPPGTRTWPSLASPKYALAIVVVVVAVIVVVAALAASRSPLPQATVRARVT